MPLMDMMKATPPPFLGSAIVTSSHGGRGGLDDSDATYNSQPYLAWLQPWRRGYLQLAAWLSDDAVVIFHRACEPRRRLRHAGLPLDVALPIRRPSATDCMAAILPSLA